MFKEKKYSSSALLTFFFIGILIAANIFLVYGYLTVKKTVDGQQKDILNIVQAYNNLINVLQDKNIINTETEKQ